MIEIASALEALAWEIQRLNPKAQLRLEVPLYGLAGRGALIANQSSHPTTLGKEDGRRYR